MTLDLGKFRGAALLDKETSPRDIFNLRPLKIPKYHYLRDVGDTDVNNSLL
jgi:hypothetical protein